jgi:molybdopterin-guanine dinucleotide biosynthesis protein A
MGGVDKAALSLHGVTLLERALAATVSAIEVVVVGAPTPTSRPVTWTVEDPPLGGPAAGLLAGLEQLTVGPGLVAVLAVDMPGVNSGTMARLTWATEADPDVDGAVLVDPDGRRQPLAAVYRVSSLWDARPVDPAERHGLSMRRLVGGLRLVEVAAVGDEAHDVDTWEDVRELRAPSERGDQD